MRLFQNCYLIDAGIGSGAAGPCVAVRFDVGPERIAFDAAFRLKADLIEVDPKESVHSLTSSDADRQTYQTRVPLCSPRAKNIYKPTNDQQSISFPRIFPHFLFDS